MNEESAAGLLTSVSRLTAAPGKERLLQDTLMSTIAMGRAADGNRGFAVHVSKDDPAEFMLIEHWTDKEAHEKHKKEPDLLRNMEFMKQQGLAKEDPVETHWTELE